MRTLSYLSGPLSFDQERLGAISEGVKEELRDEIEESLRTDADAFALYVLSDKILRDEPQAIKCSQLELRMAGQDLADAQAAFQEWRTFIEAARQHVVDEMVDAQHEIRFLIARNAVEADRNSLRTRGCL